MKAGDFMILKELIEQGESKSLEFKRVLPDVKERYLKTVIAFSNTSGGKLIIGIDDQSREIIGVQDEFRLMDAITNAISDSCEPMIYAEIYPHTIEGKTIIVIEIPRGKLTPYFLKS